MRVLVAAFVAVLSAWAYGSWSSRETARHDALAHLRAQFSSPVLQGDAKGEQFCSGSRHCFRFAGIDPAGQLQQGVIAWRYK